MEDPSVNWRKASYSNGGATSCVEVGNTPGHVLVRDTKQDGRADRTVVRFAPGAWQRFTASLR